MDLRSRMAARAGGTDPDDHAEWWHGVLRATGHPPAGDPHGPAHPIEARCPCGKLRTRDVTISGAGLVDSRCSHCLACYKPLYHPVSGRVVVHKEPSVLWTAGSQWEVDGEGTVSFFVEPVGICTLCHPEAKPPPFEDCLSCQGTGEYFFREEEPPATCPYCHGAGYLTHPV